MDSNLFPRGSTALVGRAVVLHLGSPLFILLSLLLLLLFLLLHLPPLSLLLALLSLQEGASSLFLLLPLLPAHNYSSVKLNYVHQ